MAISSISYLNYQSNNINFKGTNLVNVAQKQKKNLKAVFLGLAGLLGYKVIKDNNKDFQITSMQSGKEGVLIDYIDSNGKLNCEFFKQTEKEKMMDFLSENYGIELDKNNTSTESDNKAISIKEDNNGVSVYVGQRGEFIPTFYLTRKETQQKQQSPMITSLREQYIPNIRYRAETTGQQVKTELSQGIKDLISQGIMTQKEAEMFNEIYNLEGEEFARKAYDLIAKSMGLPKYPKLIIDKTQNITDLAHTGEDITIYLESYKRDYGNKAKTELINFIRHELEHYKQSLIIVKQKGENAYKDAYIAGKKYRINDKACLSEGNNKVEKIVKILNEEAAKLGLSIPFENEELLFNQIFEHETPIKTIRTLTKTDWEKLYFSEEELVMADEYLLSTRFYKSFECLPHKYLLSNGRPNNEKIRQNTLASQVMGEIADKGYLYNPLEIAARQAGESLKDKFEIFQETITR